MQVGTKYKSNFLIKTKNKLHHWKIGKCQFRYKGTSKPFVESIYSIEAVKTKGLFTSLNQPWPKRSTFEMLESSLLNIFSSILWSLFQSVSLAFEKYLF